MKIGIITDIHGRLSSLKEALKRLSNVDLIINLGDIAGFEPDVNECYEILKKKHIVNIMGNHEYEVIGVDNTEMDYGILNRDGISLSQDFGVNSQNKLFIRQFKILANITLDGIRYSFCHGYPTKYNGHIFFDYLSDENLLDFSRKLKSTVIFCGHIHRPQLMRARENEYEFLDEIDKFRSIHLNNGTIYGFNVGMLSRNRQNPSELQYCLLDTTEQKVDFIFS